MFRTGRQDPEEQEGFTVAISYSVDTVANNF